MKIERFFDFNPFIAVYLAGQHLNRTLNQELNKNKISLLQALVLTALFFEEDHQAKPSDLAKALSSGKSNISHTLSGLEEMRLIARCKLNKANGDSRVQPIRLTVLGQKRCLALIEYFNRLQTVAEKQMGDDESLQQFNSQVKSLIKSSLFT